MSGRIENLARYVQSIWSCMCSSMLLKALDHAPPLPICSCTPSLNHSSICCAASRLCCSMCWCIYCASSSQCTGCGSVRELIHTRSAEWIADGPSVANTSTSLSCSSTSSVCVVAAVAAAGTGAATGVSIMAVMGNFSAAFDFRFCTLRLPYNNCVSLQKS